jgi:hypothetical protein
MTPLDVARHPRWLLAAAAGLLAVPFALPLWHTRLTAPQYRNEEALHVRVYAQRVAGDLRELDTLNDYVGVRLPLDGIEVRLLPWVFGALVLVVLASALLPARMLRAAASLVLVLVIGIVLGGVGVLQYRLYEMGHERGEQIFERISDFTPPLLGKIQVANFEAQMGVGLGGWALLAAAIVCFAAAWGAGAKAQDRDQGTPPASADDRDGTQACAPHTLRSTLPPAGRLR